LWKPNLGELSTLSGYQELTNENTLEAARKIIENNKAEVIVVSLGAAGAMLVTRERYERFATPVVARKSSVGAGDSMVAGIVLSLSEGRSLSDAIRYGVACGTAATMNPGTELCKANDVDRLYQASIPVLQLTAS
jgi:6-phosphofructokinase 2